MTMPSGADPGSYDAATGANPASGYDASALDGTIAGAGLSALAGRTQDSVSAQKQQQVSTNPTWTAISNLFFAGLNPDGNTPFPLLFIKAILKALGVDTIITDIEHGLSVLANAISEGAQWVASAVTGLANAGIDDAKQFFANMRSFFGNAVNFLENDFNPIKAAGQFISLILMPLNLLLGRNSQVQLSSLTNTSQQLLLNPSFSGDISVSGNGVWNWDSLVYYGSASGDTDPGSVMTQADGTFKALRSNTAPVSSGQTIDLSVNVLADELVATADDVIQFMLIPSSDGVEGEPVVLGKSGVPVGAATGWNDPGTATAVTLSGSYTVPDGVDAILVRLVVTDDAHSGYVWFDSASEMRVTDGLPPSWVSGLQQVMAMVNQMFDIISGAVVTPINDAVQTFKDWVGNLSSGVSNILDALWLGLTGQHQPGATAADVGNAAAQTAAQAAAATTISELNNAVLAVRNNKSLMEGVDETEEANFALDSMFSGGADPVDVIAATSASVPVAYWRASQTAKKGFISWFGKGQVLELHVDIYRANFDTNTWDLLHTSPNLSLLTSTSWKYTIYNIADVMQRIDVNPGDVLGVAWRVVGSGTHYLGGKSAGSWLGDHPTVIPARPASTRTGVGALAFGSTTYSSDVPWFGIGIISGDVSPPVWSPQTVRFNAPAGGTGATTGYLGLSGIYQVPDLMVPGDLFDIVMVGDGGGGGAVQFGYGNTGGTAGKWGGWTLVYGVHIPVGTKLFKIAVGPGGDGGNGGNLAGDWGLGCSVTIPGYGTLAVDGGLRNAAPNANGQSPGNFTYPDPATSPNWSQTYQGGATAVGNNFQGNAPGGGGAGGGVTGAGPNDMNGAPGAVWITARQGDSTGIDMSAPTAPTVSLLSTTSDTLNVKAA